METLRESTPDIVGQTDTCTVTLRHAGAVIRGSCLSYNELQAHLVVEGRVSEGTRTHLLLEPGDTGQPLEAMARVASAPPQPVRGGRWEVVVELLSPPAPAAPDTVPIQQDADPWGTPGGDPWAPPTATVQPSAPPEMPSFGTEAADPLPWEPPGAADEFSPPDLGFDAMVPDDGDFVVGEHVRQVSTKIQMPVPPATPSADALQAAPEPAPAPPARPVPDPRRLQTGAYIQEPTDDSDEAGIFVRYRRPESFVAAYEEHISKDWLYVATKRPLPDGSPVRIRFRLPRQTITYGATGTVDAAGPRQEEESSREGMWLHLDQLPAETRAAFESAFAAHAPGRSVRKRNGFFSFFRRQSA